MSAISRATAPLRDLRVVDLSTQRAGSVCTMLLAGLGADVVRPETEAGRRRRVADRMDVRSLMGDRDKVHTVLGSLDLGDVDLARLAAAADVIVVDDTPARLEAAGLAPHRLAAHNPRAVVGWFPANGFQGAAAELPEDPFLLAAISGFAQLQPAADDAPVVPVVAYPSNIQGALGASSVLAALAERAGSGRGQVVSVSGLHAATLLLATLSGASLDQPMAYTAPRDTRAAPSFRLYRCADGKWLFLGALVPTIFITALDALDLVDVMVMPGIDGEFMNIFVGDNGRRVAARLEARFAEGDRAHWLDVLAAAGVPSAAVEGRDAWVTGDAFGSVAGLLTCLHPSLGHVAGPIIRMGWPIDTTPRPGWRTAEVADVWTGRASVARGAAGESTVPRPGSEETPARAPLAGLRVLDCSTFLAGPTGPTILGQWGAEVIKVEPPAGDPYRLYNVAYTGANQGKRKVVLDLGTDEGMAAFRTLLRDADVLVDNFRPSLRDRLGFQTDALHAVNPRLVHATVSAFGEEGQLADVPGFDPVIQACSGLMDACGDGEQPHYTSTPVHDVATGALVLLAVLAALYERDRTGRGRHVALSLAGSSALVQLAEMTALDGQPIGSPERRVAARAPRRLRAADGWVALAAHERHDSLTAWARRRGDLRAPVGEDALTVGADDLSCAELIAELAALGITAVRVVERDELATDPHLAAHELRHVVHDADIGRCLVVAQVARFGRSPTVDTATGPSGPSEEPAWRS